MKLLLRFTHLVSTAFLSGTICLQHCFNLAEHLNEYAQFKVMCAIMGVLLFISGIANVFVIRSDKPNSNQRKAWTHLFALKFCLAMLLTPAIRPLQAWLNFDDDSKLAI